MDVEQQRLYIREWKRNKPHLPKSTSLPLLRLAPQHRAIFVCKQCGFSNFLVPMCLWCCWSSAEARHEFEANARKTLRRAARSAPRLFDKPGLSMNFQRGKDSGTRKQQQRSAQKTPNFRRTHFCGHSSVVRISSTARGTAQRSPTWLSNGAQVNGGREERIYEPRTSKSQGLDTECGIDDCGTGSTKNNYCPTGVGFQHPPPSTVFSPLNHSQAGHRNKTIAGGIPPYSPPNLPTSHRAQPCFQLIPLPTLRFSARSLLATLTPSRGPRGPVGDRATENSRVIRGGEKTPKTKSSFRTMIVNRPSTDTRCNTTTASYIARSWTTATHASTTMCDNKPKAKSEYDTCSFQDSKDMDVDGTTIIQSIQVLPSPMNQTEACTTAEQGTSSDLDATTEMTLTKAGKKRAPIPSIMLKGSSTCSDTPIASGHQASPIPMTTEMATSLPEKDSLQSPSPVRTLRRKKRLSLANLSNISTSNLIPPDPPLPLSPPPLQVSASPQLSPTFPFVATPPLSPEQCSSPPGKFSPIIVLSTPTSTTPMLVQPSRPIPPLTTKPSQTLPRIGTPKRPYYSTIRANMNARSGSSTSPVSTPPASPSSSAFTSACGSPASGGTPGSPDRSPHLSASVGYWYTSVDDNIVTANGTSVGATSPSASAIQTIPPLPPGMTSPVPIPIPVQMHMRPCSPVRSILSVLDPDQSEEGDEDDDEPTTHYFGMSSSKFTRVLRERRSGNMKEKGKARGDHSGGGYHFPLSLSLSLGKKRSRTLATANQKLDRNDSLASRTLSASRSYAGLGGIGMGRGCSMSGEMEMRMALAERSVNANGGSGLEPSFKFRENHRPSYDTEVQVTRSESTGKKLMKMRSTIGFSSASLPSSPPRSPSSLKIGSRLKEMSATFLGKFQGGDANHF